jgi:hypothetical protein
LTEKRDSTNVIHMSVLSQLCVFFIHLAILLCTCNAVAQTADERPLDSDRDGLSDKFEQALLEQFRPTVMISSTDCAARPSRFKAGHSDPEAVAADGTIYGQVFPTSDNRIEIHYYTLWDRDCGRNSHPLDAEHAAVLISKEAGSGWKALYWYAGAHEKTVCDISSGARSEAVAAEHRGPKIWVSSGKHALYLRKAMCDRGCGADSCDDNIDLAHQGPVINLGELNAPANGSLWIASPKWPLSDKMDSDFPADVIGLLDATSGETVVTLRGNSSVRGTLRRGDDVLHSAATGTHHTGAALDTADDHTSTGVGKATKATGKALGRAWKAVFGRKQASREP